MSKDLQNLYRRTYRDYFFFKQKVNSICLDSSHHDHFITNLTAGTTVFVTLSACNTSGVIVAKSHQLETQTIAVIETPVLRVG